MKLVLANYDALEKFYEEHGFITDEFFSSLGITDFTSLKLIESFAKEYVREEKRLEAEKTKIEKLNTKATKQQEAERIRIESEKRKELKGPPQLQAAQKRKSRESTNKVWSCINPTCKAVWEETLMNVEA